MLWLLCFWAVLVSVSAADGARHFVYRSEDRGRSWVRSDSGLPGNARVNALAATEDSVVAGTDAGIFVSRDLGKSWENSIVTGTNAIRVVAAAAVKGQLFAAAESFMLVSSDAGRTWLTNQTFPRRIARALFSHRDALYVGTDTDGAYRSTDSGRSWTHLAKGLPGNPQVLAFAAVENEVFAGLYGKGLYKLEQGADNWTRIGAAEGIKPLALASTGKSLVAGHNPGGIYLSEDAGRTWNRWSGEKIPSGPADAAVPGFELTFGETSVSLDAPVWELGADNEMVFAGAGEGIFYSGDHGRSWTRAKVGLPAVSPGVAFLVRSNFVLAATLSNYKSYSVTGAKE